MSVSEADRFAAAYTAVRSREGWADRDRRRRASAIEDAVALIRRELGAAALIVDVGAGATRLPGVVAIDLMPGADVRADMRALPLGDASVDAVLYAASLHYAPAGEAVGEAARVLRAGGMLVALDSPVYAGQAAAAEAARRSAAYYARAGQPWLAERYHPIELEGLRRALDAAGFEVLRLAAGSSWRRLLRRGPASLVLARRLR